VLESFSAAANAATPMMMITTTSAWTPRKTWRHIHHGILDDDEDGYTLRHGHAEGRRRINCW
jgi:hypothetical protein